MLELVVAWLTLAQDPEVARIRKEFEAARPTEKELAVFQLDWEPDFAKAKERSRKERRPFLFIWNSNISGPDSLYTGHC